MTGRAQAARDAAAPIPSVPQPTAGNGLGVAVNFLLLIAPQLGLHSLLGSSWLNAAFAIGGLLLLYKLYTFPRWHDEMRYAPRFGLSVLFILAVVVVENLCTFATSASDARKHSYVPLQDNAEIGLLWLFQRYPLARQLVLGWRVDMHFLIYAFVALCLSVMWDQVPYSGFGMGTRFIDTIAWTHIIRTLAFMTTVLPNPRLRCYARNFPPVPADWREFLAIGLSTKRGSGCNDLVISGHGVVYAAVPLALGTYCPLPSWRFGPAMLSWLAVIKLCIQETVDKTHYSVDMLLAVVLTALVWRWQEGLYPPTALPARPPGSPPDPLPLRLVALVLVTLVVVFVGVSGT
ncbi:hypothetical protein D9Q98_007139 [Chlorella vulgaris]|uniref:Sphingomyelin synthase-like domain-containing protein n=1 Tax=Chlorella vulgaris TaxID=3077 RepID=A0A9D4YUP3_CHLVU|nr:hypothetical protein D9Q98_007139 [Chlorella vulgaris]